MSNVLLILLLKCSSVNNCRFKKNGKLPYTKIYHKADLYFLDWALQCDLSDTCVTCACLFAQAKITSKQPLSKDATAASILGFS
jgi:hypothetical protein